MGYKEKLFNRSIILYILFFISFISSFFAINFGAESFLKYEFSDTAVYYSITNNGLILDDGENEVYKLVNQYGADFPREGFYIAHQVYRFIPYLLIGSFSKLINISSDYLIMFFNFFALFSIFVAIKKIFDFEKINSNLIIIFLLIYISIPYGIKMLITVPYALNYTFFIASAIFSIYFFYKQELILCTLFIFLSVIFRQSGILISLSILLFCLLKKDNMNYLFSFVQFIFSLLFFLVIKYKINSYGYTDKTFLSFISFFNINDLSDIYLFIKILFKLLISFSPIIFFYIYYKLKVSFDLYLLCSITLFLQPLLGFKFTGLSISIVASLGIPFLLISIFKNIKTIKIEKIDLFFFLILTFMSTHKSWDFFGRFLYVNYNIEYFHISFIVFLLLCFFVGLSSYYKR